MKGTALELQKKKKECFCLFWREKNIIEEKNSLCTKSKIHERNLFFFFLVVGLKMKRPVPASRSRPRP